MTPHPTPGSDQGTDSARPPRRIRATGSVAACVAALLVLAGCSSGSSGSSGRSTTPTPSVTTRLSAELPGGETASTPRPPSRATSTDGIKPVPPASRAAGRVREVRRACPYISNDAEQIAEGKKVGRSTVLITNPLGCRFYLAYPDYHAVAQITVRKYPSEVAAFNTVARTGGSSAQSTPGIGDGAVLYRTRFFPPDGGRDWACVFAKATTVVTVLTDATLSSVDARNVAVAIVGKF